jgi:hypothetical protein
MKEVVKVPSANLDKIDDLPTPVSGNDIKQSPTKIPLHEAADITYHYHQ